jgi:ferredoxin
VNATTPPAPRADRPGESQPAATALRIDRTACTGIGMCARLLPGAIALDPWGYPVVDADAPVTDRDVRRAEHACPRRALHASGSQ